VEECISDITFKLPEEEEYRRKLAVLLLQKDPFLEESLKKVYGEEAVRQVCEEADSARRQFNGNIGRVVNRKRNQWIDEVVGKVVRKQKISRGEFLDAFGRLSRHPVFGIPILTGILLVMFFSVVDVANSIAEWLNQTFWMPIENQVNALVTSGFWNDFLVGDYGVLTLGLSNAILTVLPILSVFFILFNILEDIGYIPNLCVLLKRIFGKIGLSGSSILPITLGFGCKTMATLTTKSLRSKRERYISIYLIAFALPCAAQMGLNMSILGRMGIQAFGIAFLVLVFVEVAAGIALNKVMQKELPSDFIQELPAMRLPSFKAVLKKTYYKLCIFLKEALPVFIYAAIILFAADKTGLLDVVKNMLRPVIIGFLGFPIQMVDVLILCMAKHEAAAGLLIKLVQRGQVNYVQCIVAVTLTTMFVPCLANIMAMIKELGAKSALIMVVIINSTSILIAGILNWVLIALL
jgi:ferrous iron transport protein B